MLARVSARRATSSFHLHLSLPRGFVRPLLFLTRIQSSRETISLPGRADRLVDTTTQNTHTRARTHTHTHNPRATCCERDMFLTSEPLADSVLAPRRDRLHARSAATVAAPAPRRAGRLLPLRAAGGGQGGSRGGVGR